MKILSSCHQAIDDSISQEYFAIAHLYSDEKPMAMHIHDSYEIYFSISGGKQFLIDNRFYDIRPGDIFFINQYESHHLTQIDTQIHERIVLSIYPDYLKSLCTHQTDLDQCFSKREEDCCHKISLTAEEQKRFYYYIHKISDISGYGSDILEQAAFLELMTFLNSCFLHGLVSIPDQNPSRHRQQVDGILTYIDRNISESFGLEELSAHFYLSPSYLCRIFKSVTGTTINKYIVAKRITLAKSLLTEGCSVTEACERCGFNDYSNFLKAFKKATGVSPKKYSQFSS